jgi:hypothetical protein
MPRIAELREIEDQMWARMEMDKYEGAVTLWTEAEIRQHANAAVRDFLIDLYHQWKDRQ